MLRNCVGSVLFFLLFFGMDECLAQFHQNEVYTTRDGLPFTEVIRVHITGRDVFWLEGTAGELCRYNGRDFDCVLKTDLDLTGYIRTFFEVDSMVWIQTDDNEPMVYKGGAWSRPENGGDIIGCGNDEDWGVVGMKADGQLMRYNSVRHRWDVVTQLALSRTDSVRRRSFKAGAHLQQPLVQEEMVDGTYRLWALENGPVTRLRRMPSDMRNIQYWVADEIYYVNEMSELMVRTAGKNVQLQHINGDPVYSYRNYYIDGGWYFGVYALDEWGNREGFQVFRPTKGESHIVERVLNVPCKSEVFNVDRDRGGNFWLSSHQGLIRCRPHILSFMEGYKGMIAGLHAISEDAEGHIWFGGYGDGLCYFDGREVKRPDSSFQSLDRILPGSFRNTKGDMYFWEERQGLIRIRDKGWERTEISRLENGRPTPGYFMLPYGADSIALGFNKIGLGLRPLPLYEPSSIQVVGEDKGLELKNILAIARDERGRFWCGRSSAGLGLYDPSLDTACTWLNKDHDNQLKVRSLVVDGRGNLWMGCYDGLKLLRSPATVSVADQDVSSALETVNLGKIRRDNISGLLIHDGYLIISGKRGHGFLDLDHFYNQGRPRLYFWNTEDPAQGGGGEQNALFVDSKGYIWVGKDGGAIRMDMNHLALDTAKVDIILDEIYAGNEPISYTNKNELELPVKKRSLQLKVGGSIQGMFNDQVYFTYRLRKANIDSLSYVEVPPSGRIRIDYLSPGAYDLEFQAIKNNEIVGERSIPLYVPFILIESPLFWLGLVVFVLLSVLSIFYFQYISKYKLKKKELELSKMAGQVDQMQVKAITSALNPHFINNSMHWLQSKMRKDPEAVQMIEKISENIRIVFSKSRSGQPYHSLKEEMNLVRNYLYIQNLRYRENLESSIPSEATIAGYDDVQLPLLQIQIHVENAIEHGIRNRMGCGWLQIRIVDEKDAIHIAVADNGIGRAGAERIQSSGTQQGVKMLGHLHRIYNQNNLESITTRYEDLPYIDATTGNRHGTVVHIVIPKKYTYAIRTD